MTTSGERSDQYGRADAGVGVTNGHVAAAARSDALAPDVAEVMGRVSRSLQAQDDLTGTLHAIVAGAVGTVPGAQHAAVSSIGANHSVTTVASTGPLAVAVDALQYETGQGPCLDALWRHATVRMDDMTVERRWPAFTAAAARLGVASMLAFQLFVRGDTLGALNLYAEHPNAFVDESEDVGLVFAAHAAVAMAGARRADQLTSALLTRDLIGQAKGILMERYGIDAQRAFAVLARSSQEANVKLRVLSEQVIAGDVPGNRAQGA